MLLNINTWNGGILGVMKKYQDWVFKFLKFKCVHSWASDIIKLSLDVSVTILNSFLPVSFNKTMDWMSASPSVLTRSNNCLFFAKLKIDLKAKIWGYVRHEKIWHYSFTPYEENFQRKNAGIEFIVCKGVILKKIFRSLFISFLVYMTSILNTLTSIHIYKTKMFLSLEILLYDSSSF